MIIEPARRDEFLALMQENYGAAMSPDEFEKFIVAETAKWADVIHAASRQVSAGAMDAPDAERRVGRHSARSQKTALETQLRRQLL